MKFPVVFFLTLAPIIFLTDPVSGQSISASQNPLPVGNNVTLYSSTLVSQGVWLFENNIILMIIGGNATISDSWKARVTFDPSNSSLTIKSLQLKDSGVFTLQSMDSTPFQARLTLSVQVPVSNVSLTANATNLIEFNDTAVLTCSASSGTSLSFEWMKNGVVVTPGDNIHFTDGNATLTIMAVTRNDTGPFQCMVFNGISHMKSHSLSLNISFGPSDTTMTIMPMDPDSIHRTGSNLTMACSTQSSPAATVMWMFKGKTMNKYSTKIELSNLKENDSGTYQCVFHNPITNRYDSAAKRIIVLDPLKSVVVTNISGPTIINRSFTLRCNVTGTVDMIYWWKNGMRLLPDNTTTFDMDNNTVTLNPVQLSDNGEYQCQAFNAVSNMTSSLYKVEVNYGPGMPMIMGPSVVMSGYTLTFVCNASSNPPAQYTWYRNGSLLANTSVYVKHNLTMDMSGIYICKAHNTITNETTMAQQILTVVDPITKVSVVPLMDPPKEGYPYMLYCNVTGPTDRVYWEKNGTELHNGYVFTMYNKTLSFKPLHRNDTGDYQCQAMNAVSKMTSPPYFLSVNFGPETPVVTGPTYVKSGDTATFECSAVSVPPSRFTWWFNSTEMANTSMFTTEPLTVNMSGEYTCRAYNDVMGKNSTASKMLTVVEAITSVVIKNSSLSISSYNFTLTCEVTGPYDAIYWMKNNMHLNASATDSHMNYHMEENMLKFTPVMTSNDGVYQCIASNMAAQHASANYTLLVNYGPLSVDISGPYVGLDLIVTMTCSADSRPDCDFVWYKDSDSSPVLQTGALIAFPVSPANVGTYICVATNPVTKITMHMSKSVTVTGDATTVHFSTRGGLMMVGLVIVSVLFT